MTMQPIEKEWIPLIYDKPFICVFCGEKKYSNYEIQWKCRMSTDDCQCIPCYQKQTSKRDKLWDNN